MKHVMISCVALTVLGGCVVAPYGPPYYGPSPVYAPVPAYVEPPVSLGFDFLFFGGGRGHGHGHGGGHGHGHGHGFGHGFGHRR